MATKDVTDATFAADVLQAPRPVLVDFWAEWCIPCRKIHSLLDEIAETELGEKIEIVKMNVDHNPDTAVQYGVLGLPTLTIFKDGQPVGSVTGARPKSELVRFIESAT
ncbi:MAG TPA: thioredoxin [Micromonosporaceae bacterium]|jgi:thioredoxin 1